MTRNQPFTRLFRTVLAGMLLCWFEQVTAQTPGSEVGDVALVSVVPFAADESHSRHLTESIEYMIFVLQGIADDVVINGKNSGFKSRVRKWYGKTPNMSVFQSELKPWLDGQTKQLSDILNALRQCELMNNDSANTQDECTTPAYLKSLEKACEEFNLACTDPGLEKEKDYLIDVWSAARLDQRPELMLFDYEGRATYFYSQFDANTVWDALSPPCDPGCNEDTKKAQQPMYLASRSLTLYYLYQRAVHQPNASNDNESIMAYWLGSETCRVQKDALPKRDYLVLKIPPVPCGVQP